MVRCSLFGAVVGLSGSALQFGLEMGDEGRAVNGAPPVHRKRRSAGVVLGPRNQLFPIVTVDLVAGCMSPDRSSCMI